MGILAEGVEEKGCGQRKSKSEGLCHLASASADLPHAVQAGDRAAPHLHLCQQPGGTAHAGAGGQGRRSQPRYRESRQGEKNPLEGSEGRGDDDVRGPLTIWACLLAPTHALPTWDRPVSGCWGPKSQTARGLTPTLSPTLPMVTSGALWPHPRLELLASRGALSQGLSERCSLVLPQGAPGCWGLECSVQALGQAGPARVPPV